MQKVKGLFITLVYLALVCIQPVPAPVPRCSPLIIINKLAESSNVLSDSNPYFPVPPCEYGGWVEALQEGDLRAVLVTAEPHKIPLHNFYEFIWLLKTGGPRMLRILTGQEEYIFDRNILREGYQHHTPYVRTKQLGQYTHRNPIIIDDKNTYKTIVGGKIKSLFTEGKDKEINKHYTYQGGRIRGGKGKGKGKGQSHGHGHSSGGYGAPQHHSGYGAPQHNSGYGAPSTGSGYGAPEHNSEYGAPSTGSGYGAPSTGSGYGAPSTGSGYGAPSTGSGYGAPSTGSGYGAPSTGAGYGAPSTGSGYGAPSTGSGYGAPSTGSGYGAPSTGSGYGAPQTSSGYDTPDISSGYSAASSGHHGSSLKREVSNQEAAASSIIITGNNNGLTESTYDAVPVAPLGNENPFLRKKKHIKASDYGTISETQSSLSLIEDPNFVPSSWPHNPSQRSSASQHGLTTYFNSLVDSRSDHKDHGHKTNHIEASRNGDLILTDAQNVDKKLTFVSGRARSPYFLAQRSGQPVYHQRPREPKNLFQRISEFLG